MLCTGVIQPCAQFGERRLKAGQRINDLLSIRNCNLQKNNFKLIKLHCSVCFMHHTYADRGAECPLAVCQMWRLHFCVYRLPKGMTITVNLLEEHRRHIRDREAVTLARPSRHAPWSVRRIAPPAGNGHCQNPAGPRGSSGTASLSLPQTRWSSVPVPAAPVRPCSPGETPCETTAQRAEIPLDQTDAIKVKTRRLLSHTCCFRCLNAESPFFGSLRASQRAGWDRILSSCSRLSPTSIYRSLTEGSMSQSSFEFHT